MSDRRDAHSREAGFPIVAIGASAGGLEAIERFFRAMPSDSGMAFIIIQHLSPDHKSIMAEIIQRFTAMDVQTVESGMPVRPNHVFVIPPGQDMLIDDGVLRLEPQVRTRGLRLPIDLFFRSLAEDQQERSICILMSGAGSDGTLGFKAVKAMGGITMAQDGGAKFQDMPRSAIEAGLVDFVMLAEDMPAKLMEIAQERPVLPDKPKLEAPADDKNASLKKVFQLVRLKTGHDFSRYKPNTILRRIERRMVLHGISNLQGYAALLEKDDSEAKALFGELLIGVTHFFRDPDAFDRLASEVLPRILDSKDERESIRVWVPGCSTGEEAYTLAMLITEHLAAGDKTVRIQIFCTDVDPEALEVARRGVYPESIAADITPERLGRFFYKEGKSYRVAKEIRDMLVIAQHSIIKDPPFSRLDLISCRNLLIYFGVEVQKKLIPLFHYSLNPAGFLFFGPSESLGEYSRFFSTIDGKWKIFQRKGELPEKLTDLAIFPMERAAFASTVQTADAPIGRDALPRQAERILQDEFAPPSVLVNEQYEALHFYGKVGRYLELSGGEPTRSILRLAKDDVRLDLRTVIHAALRDKEVARRDGLRIRVDGQTYRYDLIARPIPREGSSESVLLVVFQEVHAPEAVCAEPMHRPSNGDMTLVKSLEEELSSARERLQATIRALEASNEELRSGNEELMSMNEELQSSNEELETSREELQSLNEELNTVNQELQHKIEEVSKANSDLNNLLSGTKIATLFVDNDLNIKRFTPQITEFFNLLDLDIGRPLADIAYKMSHAGLVDDIRRVIRTLVPLAREVRSEDGRWFIMRLNPYRTVSNRIDGAVVTFVDITKLKDIQQDLSTKTMEFEALFRAVPDTYFRLARDWEILAHQSGVRGLFSGVGELKGRKLGSVLPRDIMALFEAAAEEISRTSDLARVDFHLTADGEECFYEARLLPIPGDQILAIIRDMSDLRQAEQEAIRAQGLAEAASRAKGDFLANMSHEIRTPLNGIVGLTNLALARSTDEKLSYYLWGVKESSRSLTSLINDILDFSKIEAGQLHLADEPFDLRQALESALQPLQLAAEAKGLILRSEIDPSAPTRLMGDDLRLRQIITNLVGNALKFTDKGEVAVQVEPARCSLTPQDASRAYLLFSVRDTGIGMSRETQRMIFDKFFQADVSTQKKFGGTGLGLSISKSLIGMMRGELWVESREGQGSTFFFTVELDRQAAGAQSAEPGRAAAQVGGKPPRSLRILLAEDNDINRVLAEELLRQAGHEVDSVADGAQALAALEKKAYDALVVDVSMPIMDGLEVTRRIRRKASDKINPELPIIALTAYALAEDRERIRESGVDAYISKPFKTEDLLQALEQATVKPS